MREKNLIDCPICSLSNQSLLKTSDYDERLHVDCIRCGRFTTTRMAVSTLDDKDKQAKISAWLKDRKLREIEIPELDLDMMREVLSSLPKYKPGTKQEKLIRAIELRTLFPGHGIKLNDTLDANLAWTLQPMEFRYHLNSLIDRGLLDDPSPTLDQSHHVTITPKGWHYLENLDRDPHFIDQCFVAMSFSPELLTAFSEGIKPAIENAGYTACRVDQLDHLERIDAKIIAEIKSSKFLIADVTGQRAGVYYEAGFAHGMGIPVIWTVREDDLNNVHFDTRQYNHIVWDTTDFLKDKLTSMILATIGRNFSK